MTTQITKRILQSSLERINNAEKELLSSWHGYCGCTNPGRHIKCQSCPYFIEFIQKFQLYLEPDSPDIFPSLSPPKFSSSYPDVVKEKCIEMYSKDYSLQQIFELTGVKNFRILRGWINQAGLLKQFNNCSEEEKEICLELYQQGLTPLQIEEKTRISADSIRNSVCKTRLSRPKNYYSEEQKQLVFSMYREGKSLSEIEQVTGISKGGIKKLVSKAKVHRKNPNQAKKGRPRIHTEEVRQHCLKLLEAGKTPPQIEEMLGISADTIRRWRKLTAPYNGTSD